MAFQRKKSAAMAGASGRDRVPGEVSRRQSAASVFQGHPGRFMNWGHVVRNTVIAIGITFVTAASTLRYDFSNRCYRRKRAPARLLGFYYCFSEGATAGGDEGSSAGVAPLSSDAPTQSPAQILVPLTVPTSLQPIGVLGFA